MPMHPAPEISKLRSEPSRSRPLWKRLLYNAVVILVVIAAGIAGYYISPSKSQNGCSSVSEQNEVLQFSVLGQVFGYICAVLYLGSRVPQLLLNYRRKSTEGLNALFFVFACLGNLTYVLSIIAFEPICGGGAYHEVGCSKGEAGAIYGRYLLVNLSWLLGSLGTLFLDFGVFVQFWTYRKTESRDDRSTVTTDSDPRDANGDGRGRSPNQR